jgi:hypothetical protein
MRILAPIAILLTLAFVPSVLQANRAVNIKGVVTKEDGKAVEGAFVLVRDYQQLSSGYIADKWESRTAADGSFSFAIENGCYDIFVSSNAMLLPFSERVCIEVERNQVLKIKLKADPYPKLRLD